MKIMVIAPIGGGRLSIVPDIVWGIKENGHEAHLFGLENIIGEHREVMLKIKESNALKEYTIVEFNKALLKEVERIRPDLVLDFGPVDSSTLKTLKELKTITCFWLLEDGFSPRYSYWKDVALLYDFFFTIQPGKFLDVLKDYGVKNPVYLPAGCNPSVDRRVELSPGERKLYGSDISFMGSPNIKRKEILLPLGSYDLKIWGRGWDGFFGKDSRMMASIRGKRWIDRERTVKIFNASKINLNIHSEAVEEDFANPRLFAIAGCGAFQLVNKRRAIPGLFEIGKEIVTFENIEDLLEKIDYYLAHPQKREEIAKNSQTRAYRDHTYNHRIREMIEFIETK